MQIDDPNYTCILTFVYQISNRCLNICFQYAG